MDSPPLVRSSSGELSNRSNVSSGSKDKTSARGSNRLRNAVSTQSRLPTSPIAINSIGNLNSWFNQVSSSSKSAVASSEEHTGFLDAVKNYVKTSKLEKETVLESQIHNLTSRVDELQADLVLNTTTAQAAMGRHEAETGRLIKECKEHLEGRITEATSQLDDMMQVKFRSVQKDTEDLRERVEQAFTQDRDGTRILEAKIAAIHTELSANIAKQWESTMALFDKQRDAINASIEKELRCGMEDCHSRVASVRGQCRDEVGEVMRNVSVRFDHFDAMLQDNMCKSKEMDSINAAQIAAVECHMAQLKDQTGTLHDMVADTEKIPTRKVDWIIRNASARLQSASASGRSRRGKWLSPKFSAGGMQGQLEVKFFRPKESEDSHDPWNCLLGFSAASGVKLVCKLYIGNSFELVSHTFENQAPCTTKHKWVLEDEICADDDTLHVGIEFLEILREVHHSPAETADAVATEDGQPLQEDAIVAHQYVNHRTLELMQSQVGLMRSRMVRRVEWRIEQASVLPQCFPKGECICSTAFEAAGVEGLQFVFYPSGGSSAREGYCSCFLYCPPGSKLQCSLSAGKQRREARLDFERPGFYGRTNFCHFDSCLNASDDLLALVLEIEQAQQDVVESLSHQLSPSPSTDRRPETPRSEKSPALERIDSSIRFERTPGRVALEDVRQLPSIWTSRPQGDITKHLDGFYTFQELRAVKKLPTPRMPAGVCVKPPSDQMGDCTPCSMDSKHSTSNSPIRRPQRLHSRGLEKPQPRFNMYSSR